MWKKISLLLVLSVMIFACKEQPPIVIENPIPRPDPSIHIIDNYYYLQFTKGKQQDTFTYEVLDDTTQWEDTSYVNYVYDARVEEIYDTTDADELEDLDERIKTGFTYAPTTTILKYLYFQILNPTEDFDVPDLEEVDQVDDDYFSIQFPFSTNDTLAFWDIEDYLNNPSLKETGIVRWGRVGNNDPNDTVWNNDARAGVALSYVDTAGVEWRSDNWPTFQPSFAYFKLNSIEANYRDGKSYDIIAGEFAVRLYDEFESYIDLRYGRFRLRILSDIELGPEPQ